MGPARPYLCGKSLQKGFFMTASSAQQAILAGGCFWCTEAVFRDVIGVSNVESGYIGGATEHPTYKQVCSGTTGHAEAIRVTFDPAAIDYGQLLDIFFATHDPTQLNRQGNDVGTQYRSAVFTHSDEQRAIALDVLDQLQRDGIYDGRIVTEVTSLNRDYYPAEGYHQNYFAQHPDQGYCAFVVAPKVAKFRKHYLEQLKA